MALLYDQLDLVCGVVGIDLLWLASWRPGLDLEGLSSYGKLLRGSKEHSLLFNLIRVDIWINVGADAAIGSITIVSPVAAITLIVGLRPVRVPAQEGVALWRISVVSVPVSGVVGVGGHGVVDLQLSFDPVVLQGLLYLLLMLHTLLVHLGLDFIPEGV